MDDNDLLKSKFQRLHAELVGQNLSTVVDRLFAAAVISAANMEELNLSGSVGWSSAKSRVLLTLLHRSGHPRAFIELRLALCEEDSMKFIVDKLDKLAVEVPSVQTDSAQCQCPNCGHSHHSALSTDGQWILITWQINIDTWGVLPALSSAEPRRHHHHLHAAITSRFSAVSYRCCHRLHSIYALYQRYTHILHIRILSKELSAFSFGDKYGLSSR